MSIRFAILERVAPRFINKAVAAEFRKKIPNLLVNHGFEVASITSLAANEIEICQTRKERKNIERNLKEMLDEIAKERKKA